MLLERVVFPKTWKKRLLTWQRTNQNTITFQLENTTPHLKIQLTLGIEKNKNTFEWNKHRETSRKEKKRQSRKLTTYSTGSIRRKRLEISFSRPKISWTRMYRKRGTNDSWTLRKRLTQINMKTSLKVNIIIENYSKRETNASCS